ncbi:ABC transporter ATP-binding protein/permease [Tyzzerella nexilis]|nr:ABC transporter ATP-binding protein/permease [[Clostridium] nexile]MCB7556595.1 ABC transporter ATP-binding protein/permease [[Clostridium] nexile]MCC3674646.1 ABC transporter ATP-binding protein/permease [[Clostridium] nexile]NSD84986.1 ABC transporter ATP-binding protein/permease [[Clostridium] nexile]NSD87268.1 ABC transporter ATP-binding protein/permease [[Clostridium] nexile]
MFHKRLIKEFRENQKNIWGMVLTQWVMLIANVVLMLQTATFIAGMVRGENLQNQSIRLLVTLAVVGVVRSLMSLFNSKLSFEASKQVKARLRTMVYEKMMRLGSSYKEYFQTSEVVQITTEGVEQLEIYFGKYMPQFFYSMLAPVTLFVIVGTMSLKVAVVLLICVPLIPLSIVAVQKFAKKMLAKYWGTYTEMGDSFLECLQGLTTLKIYQADERYAKRMDEEAEKFRKVTMRVLIMQLNSISIMDLVAYGGAAVGIILSILEYQKGVIGLAQCFFIIMISAEFFLPLRLLGSFFHIAMNGNAAADKIFRLVDLEEDQGEKSAEMEGESDEIAFSNVSFSYEAKKKVLEGISFRAGHGLTALVGESGCGKSTTTLLLMGDRRANEGQIFIGDMPIDKMDLKALRRKITRIRHDSYLFAGTIRENLLMGKEDATETQMKEALREVNLLDFVEKSGGLDFVLLEKASNLSGGQKQRLSLARALLHDTPIYIFDEATSNVDVESENDIMAVVRKLAKTKTVLLISHRLANVVSADQIYVLKDGMIVEKGQHEALCKEDGYYHRLFRQQSALEQFGKGAVANE